MQPPSAPLGGGVLIPERSLSDSGLNLVQQTSAARLTWTGRGHLPTAKSCDSAGWPIWIRQVM